MSFDLGSLPYGKRQFALKFRYYEHSEYCLATFAIVGVPELCLCSRFAARVHYGPLSAGGRAGNDSPVMNDSSMFVDLCSSSLSEGLKNAAGVCLLPPQGHNSPSAATGTTGNPNVCTDG